MSAIVSFEEGLQKAFTPTAHGIVGLVDQLLAFCQIQDAVFEWREGQLRCRPIEGEGGTVEVPLPKAAFRPILARVAALCNQYKPDSVSPYGGEGEIAAGGDPPSVFRVTFTNTPSTQRLEVREGRGEALENVLSLLRQSNDRFATTNEMLEVTEGHDEALDHVLDLFQQANDRFTNSLVADILDLGEDAVAAICDPRNWPVLERVTSKEFALNALLSFAGAPLAVKWFSSGVGDLVRVAESWSTRHWQDCWYALTDPMKYALVKHFAREPQSPAPRGSEVIRLAREMARVTPQ